MVTPACPSTAIPSLPGAFTPSTRWPPRSRVTRSAPIVSAVPGQFKRSLESRVSWLITCPHRTGGEPEPPARAGGAVEAPIVAASASAMVPVLRMRPPIDLVAASSEAPLPAGYRAATVPLW